MCHPTLNMIVIRNILGLGQVWEGCGTRCVLMRGRAL